MRSLRCDVCGTKALVAASTCPKCGHAFEVRDGFGELLPLAHCTTCDAYYPESVGGCRWCGTKPERSPIGPLGPHIWKGVGILVFASLAIGAWFAKNDSPSPPAPARTFVADTLPTNQPKPESVGRKIALAEPETASVAPADSPSVAVVDSTHHDSPIALSTMDTLGTASTPVVPSAPVAMQSAGTVVPAESAATVDPAPRTDAGATRRRFSPSSRADTSPCVERLSRKPVARAPESHRPARLPGAQRRRRRRKRYTRRLAPRLHHRARREGTSAAIDYTRHTRPKDDRAIALRALGYFRRAQLGRRSVGPDASSRIIAAIGPNTRVQLGETRGEWRRSRPRASRAGSSTGCLSHKW
jgi:hypothetical protein